MKDSTGWHLFWTSPHQENVVEKIALNAKVLSTNPTSNESTNKMVAASTGEDIKLWCITDEGTSREIGKSITENPTLWYCFTSCENRSIKLFTPKRYGQCVPNVCKKSAKHWLSSELYTFLRYSRVNMKPAMYSAVFCVPYQERSCNISWRAVNVRRMHIKCCGEFYEWLFETQDMRNVSSLSM